MKRFKNFILLAYILPGVAFILFGDFESAEKRFRPGVFDRAWFIYFFFGIFGLPLLLFGPPTMASIKAGIQSDRFKRGVKRKMQTSAASIGVGAILVVTYMLFPPRSAASATFDILVFLLMFGALVWLHFRPRRD